ncbi:MAG: hypothetical protein U5J99_12375 [Parvularculaceae bacterium]|nr:hypothetical protein [Parvularculaceae bacterium]
MRPVTLRIVLTIAGCAFGLSALAAALPAADRLQDIQIGENGAILRVALVCRGSCDVSPSADAAAFGSFVLTGIRESLDIDLTGRGGLAQRLLLKPIEGGSLLSIEASAGLNAAHVIDCRTESGPARCIDFRFDRAGAHSAAALPRTGERLAPAARRAIAPKPAGGLRAEPSTPLPTPRVAPKRQAPTPAPQLIPEPVTPGLRSEARPALPPGAPFVGAVVLETKKARRDPLQERLVVPDFAPPERLSPPKSVRPIVPRAADTLATARMETLKELFSAPRAETFNLAHEMTAITGKTADPATCEGAAARLSADAWALEAMVDLAFCKAAKGDLDAADDDFTRLLAYTPDNHQALVGRGLVAIAEGDRARGLEFLQEALNALPPIAESDRIVAAMDRY